MFDSPRHSRRLAAVGLIAAPLLFLAAFATEPAWSDDSGTYLAEIASGPNRHAAFSALFALGGLCLLAGMLGTARLLRGRRGAVARIGALAVGVAGVLIGGVVLAIGVAEVAMVAPAADRAEMTALYDRTEDVTFGQIVFGIVWMGGFVLGTLALAVGLVLRRVVSLLTPLLLVGWLATMFFWDGRAGSIVGCLVLFAAFLPLARRIATLGEEEWARWQPLADAEAPPLLAGSLRSGAHA